MGNYTNALDQRIKAIDAPHYQRESYQSYMTGPEWRNVEMVEEYADFLENGGSLFEFPYFRQMGELWRVLYHSYLAARQYNSMSEILFSEYMLMDLFVCIFTTLELLPKGLVALIVAPFTVKENRTQMQAHLAAFYKDYAQGLQTIPFFDHDYATYRRDLTEKYDACDEHTWVDWLSWRVVSAELFAREWLSKPLRYLLHQDSNEGGFTDVLVKYNAIGKTDDQAIESFRQSLARVNGVVLLESYVKGKSLGSTEPLKVYARLRAPRYKAFTEVVPALTAQGILLKKIAGQEHVQVKFKAETDENMTKINKELGGQFLYEYQDYIHAHRHFLLFDVPVASLQDKLSHLSEAGVHAEFIHNF